MNDGGFIAAGEPAVVPLTYSAGDNAYVYNVTDRWTKLLAVVVEGAMANPVADRSLVVLLQVPAAGTIAAAVSPRVIVASDGAFCSFAIGVQAAAPAAGQWQTAPLPDIPLPPRSTIFVYLDNAQAGDALQVATAYLQTLDLAERAA